LSKKIDVKKNYKFTYLSRMDQSNLNSISYVTGKSPQDLLQTLLNRNLTVKQVIDALFACLSQLSVRELLAIVEDSKLVSILTTMDELIQSGMLDVMILENPLGTILKQDMFSNFSSQIDGQNNLIAVVAMLVLLRIPTNDVTKDKDRRIEDLKLLFRSTLFHNDIATQFMVFRDEFQQTLNLCPCVNCKARFILSIGWYIAAQEAHDNDAFVENSDFLVIA
jgi:hypothetical protein